MKRYFFIAAVCISGLFILSSAEMDTTKDAKELGKLLFFDPILSSNRKISCASCHKPDLAFADSVAISEGVDGKKGDRNTPSAMNVLLHRNFFWDGRASSLEAQALAPIENKVEMNLPIDKAIDRLRKSKKYRRYFQQVFHSKPDSNNLATALAAFQRSLETSNSPFDNWKYQDDENAVTEAVKRGFVVFNGKGKCVQCHFGADQTTDEFRNIGLFNAKDWNDSGRALITKNPADIGLFKTPGLRNVAITTPYMHNGRIKTLAEVISFYNDPDKVVPNSINRDTFLAKPLGLSDQEQKDLVTFLNALTDKQFSKSTN